MSDNNLIDFVAYQEKQSDFSNRTDIISEDLRLAIEILIQRLRDNTPLLSKASST